MTVKPYVLKLKPTVKDYIWGGTKLKTKWNKQSDTQKIAECWELSMFPSCESRVINGDYNGKNLAEVFNFQKGWFGSKVKSAEEFPILIKLIDAQDNLSIQVHPNDDYALLHENQQGKTEMWYISDAEDGAGIYFGLCKDVANEEFAEAIKNNTVCDLLNFVPVKTGDFFMIEAGTVHAILKGVTVIEVQQNSNVTYRIYDYDRRDNWGNLRELHIEKGVAVSKLSRTVIGHNMQTVYIQDDAIFKLLAECKYFKVEEIECNGEFFIQDNDSFMALVIASGEFSIDGIKSVMGETVLIPLGFNAKISGSGKIIKTTI